jgi:hypothetical protein
LRGLDLSQSICAGPRVLVGNLPMSDATKTGASGQAVGALVPLIQYLLLIIGHEVNLSCTCTRVFCEVNTTSAIRWSCSRCQARLTSLFMTDLELRCCRTTAFAPRRRVYLISHRECKRCPCQEDIFVQQTYFGGRRHCQNCWAPTRPSKHGRESNATPTTPPEPLDQGSHEPRWHVNVV